MPRVFKLFILLIMLVNSSCTQVHQCQSLNGRDLQEFWNDLSSWEISGEVIVKKNKRKIMAYINWVHKKSKNVISIENSFGITLGRIKWHNSYSQLYVGDKTYLGNNPEKLVKKVLGVDIPVTKITDMLKPYQKNVKILNYDCFFGYLIPSSFMYKNFKLKVIFTIHRLIKH